MQNYDNSVELNQEIGRQTQLNFLSCLLFNYLLLWFII
jgi:hypothetical protein